MEIAHLEKRMQVIENDGFCSIKGLDSKKVKYEIQLMKARWNPETLSWDFKNGRSKEELQEFVDNYYSKVERLKEESKAKRQKKYQKAVKEQEVSEFLVQADKMMEALISENKHGYSKDDAVLGYIFAKYVKKGDRTSKWHIISSFSNQNYTTYAAEVKEFLNSQIPSLEVKVDVNFD
jgi:hypothetical protein